MSEQKWVGASYLDMVAADSVKYGAQLRRYIDAVYAQVKAQSAMDEGDHWWSMQRQKMLRDMANSAPSAEPLTSADPSELALQAKDEGAVVTERLREPHNDISTDRWREKFKAFDTPYYRRG